MIPRCSRSTLAVLLLAASTSISHGFVPTSPSPAFLRDTARGFTNKDDTDTTLAVETLNHQAHQAQTKVAKKTNYKMKVDPAKAVPKNQNDPAAVEFISVHQAEDDTHIFSSEELAESSYPFATMLQGSARYIADHLGETAVFHVPGDLLETPGFPQLIDDIALAWLLGIKIVLVVGCRSAEDGCMAEFGFEYAHECHNSLRVTDDAILRQVEEEAGFVRFEVERRLNKSMGRQSGVSPSSKDHSAFGGNVVGGNFYTTQPFGMVRGTDYQHTGYASKVHVEKISSALKNNDIVLLTTIAPSRNGELMNVNGNHLAASVAKNLEAHKLIFMSTHGTVLRQKGQEDDFLQDVSLTNAKKIIKHHQVEVHKAGFAAFENARQGLEPGAVELLLHMGWASWAVDQGVTRAHIVNPGDGTLLEELFTAKHGTNTCLFHDDELLDDEEEEVLLDDDLHNFLEAAAAQGSNFS
jgi:acetylglutamate kinase